MDAVSQLDKVTQKNASLVEESAGAADLLKRQSAELVDAVSVFKLNAQDAAPSIERHPAAEPAVAASVHALPARGRAPELERMAS